MVSQGMYDTCYFEDNARALDSHDNILYTGTIQDFHVDF